MPWLCTLFCLLYSVCLLGCSEQQPAAAVETTQVAVILPDGVIDHVGRKARGGRRSQIRAVIAKETHTQQKIEDFARKLTERYGYDHALVTFFDDSSVFANWDGKGSLVDSDWPHCLCRVLVDEDETVFNLAFDESTSKDRVDVLVGQLKK